MSFLKKVMANTLGIGGAKINTIIKTNSIYPGEVIEGVCEIKGGKVIQDISHIMLYIKTSYKRENDDKIDIVETVLQTEKIIINKTIKEDEVIQLPFKFNLNKNIPVTLNKSKVWITTSLEIENAIDSGDRDYIKVLPLSYVSNIIEAVQNMGFTLYEVENEYFKNRKSSLPFIQEFEFIPHSGEFKGKLDELEIFLIPSNTSVDIYMEVDRKARGLGGFFLEELGMDEKKVRANFTYEELDNIDYIANKIYSIINNEI